MKPSEVRSLLRFAIPAKRKVLIVGDPGIGKTSIVRQVADELGYDMITSYPGIEDPTVPAGFPFPGEGRATFLPFGALHQAIHAKRPTVWFLDDFGQAKEAVQVAYMPLLMGGNGEHRISPHVAFVAASNPAGAGLGVSRLLEPVKSRFDSIVTMEPNLEEFLEWALPHGFPPEYAAFLRYRPNCFNHFEPSVDFKNQPNPRTHAAAGLGLWAVQPPELRREAIAGAIGRACEIELHGFLQLIKTLPDIDAALAGADIPLPDNAAVLFALVSGVAAKANAKNFIHVVKLTNRLVKANRTLYAARLIHDCIALNPSVVEAPGFADLPDSEFGRRISE